MKQFLLQIDQSDRGLAKATTEISPRELASWRVVTLHSSRCMRVASIGCNTICNLWDNLVDAISPRKRPVQAVLTLMPHHSTLPVTISSLMLKAQRYDSMITYRSSKQDDHGRLLRNDYECYSSQIKFSLTQPASKIEDVVSYQYLDKRDDAFRFSITYPGVI
jgi:hypothetical protein